MCSWECEQGFLLLFTLFIVQSSHKVVCNYKSCKPYRSSCTVYEICSRFIDSGYITFQGRG